MVNKEHSIGGIKLVIGVCGFSWSGSGAVIDYLMEFEENQVLTQEYILAYHPDGLRDLDAALNENCAKFLSSGVAIPRFRKTSDFLLRDLTKGKAGKITEAYLDKLIQARWIGLEQGQQLVRNEWLYKKIGLRIREKIITRLSPEFCWKHRPYPLSQMEFSICPEQFDEITREYTCSILKAIGLNTDRNIVLNQPFPGNNPIPYMKYFPDAKAIVADRDPRDVFAFLKYVFPGHSYSVPLQDVHEFCAYFENMHKKIAETLNHPDVLYIHFEDLVYRYEETADRICSFLGLGKPGNEKRYFNPDESAANTMVFERYGDRKEIEVIEEKLSGYLYDFSKVEKRAGGSRMFDDNPKSSGYSFKHC